MHYAHSAGPHGAAVGIARYAGQKGTQLGEAERLVEVGAVERLEKAERVAANGIAGTEHEPPRRGGIAPLELLVELATAEPRHAEVRDDEIERLGGCAGECFVSVRGGGDLVAPCLQRRPHVVE